MAHRDPIQSLTSELVAGQINRREFIRRAVALGLSASAITAILAACGASATATPAPTAAPSSAAASSAAASASTAGAASAAPSAAASSAAASASARPSTAASAAASTSAAPSAAASTSAAPSAAAASSAAPRPTKRGGGGQVKVLWWQAPVVLNPHLVQGQKDTDASRPVYEPLAVINGDGSYIPVLAAEIPSRANNGLSADGTSVTWKLKSGVKWSDGTPFTAKDVVFTYQYVIDQATAATTLGAYRTIKTVEAVDDTTVKITFTAPQAAWFIPFVNQQGCILPEHVFKDGKGAAAANFPANLKPVGTGPFKLVSFKPGDEAVYDINPNYRDANAPFFDGLLIKGGGDAPSAARAVLQTGDFDYAWNLQVDAAVLAQLEQGGKGTVVPANGPSTERILINFTDPNKEDPETKERSSLKNPHPFQTDKAVRNAYALACDKKTIVDTIYGKAGSIATNLLFNPPQYASPNTKYEYDLTKANALLDGAGWAKSGQYRAKGGVQMKITYSTTVNAVRQKTQQVVKDGLEKIGIQVELKSADASVFFAPGSGGNPDSASLFYNDIEMYTNGNVSPDPFSYMEGLSTAQIAQKSNQHSGNNYMRWSNKEYDAVIEQLKTELDEKKRAELFIKANDIEINDFAEIPLVARKQVFATTKTLEVGSFTPWDSELWNIAFWLRK